MNEIELTPRAMRWIATERGHESAVGILIDGYHSDGCEICELGLKQVLLDALTFGRINQEQFAFLSKKGTD